MCVKLVQVGAPFPGTGLLSGSLCGHYQVSEGLCIFFLNCPSSPALQQEGP